MGIKDGRVSIGVKARANGYTSSTRQTETRESDTLSAKYLRHDVTSSRNSMEFKIPERGSLLGNFNMRMKKIQLEHANQNTKLAIGGPSEQRESCNVVTSGVFQRAQEDIKAKKIENMVDLMDSVLKKNQEEDDDDVLFGDGGNLSDDLLSPDMLNDLKVDYTYNR